MTDERYSFEESEVPYETLSKFGLTHEMIEDLPSDILDEIFLGHKTPLLPIKAKTDDGIEIQDYTRFSLVRKANGEVDVLFYPRLDEIDLNRYSAEEKSKLKSNHAIIGDYTFRNGRTTKAFIQLDPETSQVLAVPTPVIGRNLQLIADELDLDSSDLVKLQDGKVLTKRRDNSSVSLGIDLNFPHGIRFATGDETQWNRENKREWDRFNFGIYGCWTQDNEGNLQYIYEEDYTQELWDAQQENIQKAYNIKR